MGYSIMKQNDKIQYNIVEYIVDSTSEINTLPTDIGPGSTCLVTGTSEVYVLNTNKQWVKMA